MENYFYSQGRIRDYVKALGRLKRAYEEHSKEQAAYDTTNGMCTDLPLAVSVGETAAFLERFIGEDNKLVFEEKSQKKQICDFLKSNGIGYSNMVYLEASKGHSQIVLTLWRTKKGTFLAKDIAAVIGQILNKRYRLADGSRKIVCKDPGDFVFEEETNYRVLYGFATLNRGQLHISGDTYSYIEAEGGKSIFMLADGMGCGEGANMSSTGFIELVEDLLLAGFSEKASMLLANSVFASHDEKGVTIAADMCSIDEYEGIASFYKMGAAVSFIKSGDEVFAVESQSLPAGVLDGIQPEESVYSVSNGDYIIMISDGVLDALPFYDKEKYLCELISATQERMPKSIAQKIINEVSFFDEKISDDMTVIVMGVFNKNITDY